MKNLQRFKSWCTAEHQNSGDRYDSSSHHASPFFSFFLQLLFYRKYTWIIKHKNIFDTCFRFTAVNSLF